ncbi:MAG: iron ABC transporter permease [Treponema sp.]|nr:iron ABC transporter permease [Treponema sp.]
MKKIDFRKNSRSLLAIWLLLLGFFALFVAFPLVCVLISARPEDFKAVFSSHIFRQAMRNTLLECIASSSLSVLTGYIFAYAIIKARVPGKKFFASIPLIHLMTPPFVGGLSFILLIGRQGFITKTLLGLDISLYGFPGLLIAQTLSFFPLSYLICLQNLSAINPNLEEAARSLGANNKKIFFTITLPLSIPGILSSFLFIAVNVLSDFGNPLIVAGRFRVLAVEIYNQLTGWLNSGKSAVLGIILVIPSVILFLLQNRLLKKQGSKIAINTGKLTIRDSSSGRLADFFLSAFVYFISLCVLLQFIAIIAGSFQKLWGINMQLTFEHIKVALSGRYSKGIINSVLYSIVSAALGTAIASFTSYIVHRTDAPLRKTLDSFAQLPSAIPGTLLGLSILTASQKVSFKNSSALIIIAMTVAFLPFSYRIVSQSYSLLRKSLDDGARSLGANQFFTFVSIIIPLSKTGIFSGFLYAFIRGAGTLSAVIFLVSFNTPLASINIVNLAEQGDWGNSAALALLLTCITFTILALGTFITKKRLKIMR